LLFQIPNFCTAYASAAERLAAVDTRSIKKVAEAKFRKKKRAETKMQAAFKRAGGAVYKLRAVYS
jgi:AdoMet-dependent rRNA methyltransferase SPB1